MRIQFRVKTQSGIDSLLIEDGTKDECHFEGKDGFCDAELRKVLSSALRRSDFSLSAGDTIHLVDLDE